MGKLGGNKLNKGFIGVNKFSSSTEGIKNPRNDYLNQVVNATDVSNLSPSFSLDFTGPTWQNQVVFSRGTTASFLGSSGYITFVGPNIPRIQYDRFGNTMGLLMEPPVGARWSNNDLSTWSRAHTLSGATYNNVALAPDGTTTAHWLVPSTLVWPNHGIYVLSGLLVANIDGYLSHSFFAKAAEYSALYTSISRSSSPFYDFGGAVDLLTGNVYTYGRSDGAYGYIVVEPYPNNWWKITVSMKARDGTNQQAWIAVLPNSNMTFLTSSWAGSGNSGIYVWGSNYNGVGAPTQYIGQTGFVGKAADRCFISGASLSNWYTYPGCFYMEYYNKPDKFNMTMSADLVNANMGRLPSPSCIFGTPYAGRNTMMITNTEMTGNRGNVALWNEDYFISENGKTGYQELNKTVFAISGTTLPYTIRYVLNGSDVQKTTTSNFDARGLTCLMFGCRGFLNSGATVPAASIGEYNGVLKEFRFYNQDLTDDQLRALTR